MFTVEILGHKYKAPSVAFASRTVQSVRDNLAMLGEGGASQMGSRFPVRDANGRHVADVSYNGRVWPCGRVRFHNVVTGAYYIADDYTPDSAAAELRELGRDWRADVEVTPCAS